MNGLLRTYRIGIALFVAMGLVPIAVGAYEVIDVQHGGTIEGVVTLTGDPPEPKGFNLITFPNPVYCGRISNGRGCRLL